MVKGNPQSFQDMSTCLSLLQFEFSPTTNNFNLVNQIMMKDFLECENFRLIINNRQHINPECALHCCMLKQIVQYNIRIYISTELNHYTHTGTI
ncbi:hypothetical protein D3C81_1146280 [compost metagenome]